MPGLKSNVYWISYVNVTQKVQVDYIHLITENSASVSLMSLINVKRFIC